MKIGVVAYEMEGPKTGVGRYLEGLLGGIAAAGAGAAWRWQLFFKGDPFPHPLWDDPGGPFTAHFDRRPGARPILWEQLRLPRLLRAAELDALFSPAYSLPPGVDVPSLVTVHDLSFEHRAADFDWKERWRRRWLARRSVHRARRVLADTAGIARELERTYRLPPAKLGVVPLGIEDRFLALPAPADGAALAALGIRPPYLLFLGSILPRRHVDLVIGALAAVAAERPELRLVLAGANRLRRPRQLDELIAGSGVEERILRLGYVAEDALPALYRGAELSFYLSAYEGYGLPPLESLAAGTPAIVGRGLALDELWPAYPYRCERLEPGDVIATVRRALDGADERRRVGQEGRERMARLTWRRAAERFLGELEEALR